MELKKTYSITIKESVINNAQKYFNEYGGKLSPLIEKLLIDWINKQIRKEKS